MNAEIYLSKVHGLFTDPSYRGIKLGAIACAGTIIGLRKSLVSEIDPLQMLIPGSNGRIIKTHQIRRCLMLKRIVVGILTATVAVAAGISIYNASATPQVAAQVETSAAALAQASPEAVETSTADAVQETPLAAAVDSASTYQAQGSGSGPGNGAGYGGGQGGGRRAGQSGQNGMSYGATTESASGSFAPGGAGQGAGRRGADGTSGRPSWAGGNRQDQGVQP
jgi:hypothetical protein